MELRDRQEMDFSTQALVQLRHLLTIRTSSPRFSMDKRIASFLASASVIALEQAVTRELLPRKPSWIR
jgi:hypothetical protein